MIPEFQKSCELTVGFEFFMSVFEGSLGFSLASLGTMHPHHGCPKAFGSHLPRKGQQGAVNSAER